MKSKITIATVLMLSALSAVADEKANLSPKEVADQLIVFAAGYCRGAQVKHGTDFTDCFMQVTDLAIAKLRTADTKAPVFGDEIKTLVLTDGTTARVISSNGTTRGYLKGAPLGVDGKVSLAMGEVFEGDKVAKKPDGTCVQVRTKLVSMDEAPYGEGKIQVPKTTTETAVVDCNS